MQKYQKKKKNEKMYHSKRIMTMMTRFICVRRQGFKILFVTFTGILGNEEADKLAVAGANKQLCS